MGSFGGSGFEKRRQCPSSETLLAYQQSELSSRQKPRIASHLADCDFCAAELLFLSRHPPANERFEVAEMPFALCTLAKALLIKESFRSKALLDEFYRKETRTLTRDRVGPLESRGVILNRRIERMPR